jgi:16S rRNA (adenine(1408)-N(1))-methyltransferase
MRVLRGVEEIELDRYDDIHVDLGTGDGKFVLRSARARPERLVVGIDALTEAMTESASRAARKPSRGGAPNAWFVAADATDPLPPLAGRAALVTVNYPWGSLLRAVAEPNVPELRAIASLLRPGAPLIALLNLSAAEDSAYAEKLELPPLDGEHIGRRLVPGWREAGLDEVEWRALGPGEEPPHRTTWGQRLVRGSGRETLLVSGVRSPD